MNIVWLRAEPLLPLNTGGKIRSYNLLRGISREEAVTYVGLRYIEPFPEEVSHRFRCPAITIPAEPEEFESLWYYFKLTANMGSAYPYMMKVYQHRDMRSEIRKLVQSGACQVIVCDGLENAVNVDFSLPVAKVLYHHAVETALWSQRYQTTHGLFRKAYFNFETKRMADYEHAICNRFDHVVATSDKDRKALIEDHKVRKPITVVPVGVDCSYFRPDEFAVPVRKRLLFTGALNMPSNIDQLLWFVSEVYPLVVQEHPDVSLDIIGPQPSTELLDLQRDKSIRVMGWVDDIRPYLSHSDIYIVPLRVPGGTRVKLYEAMAMRRPVISTGYGAEGLDVVNGQHLLIADTGQEFAHAINSLIDDPRRKAALAERAWRHVNEVHNWENMVWQMLDVLRSMSRKPAVRQK